MTAPTDHTPDGGGLMTAPTHHEPVMAQEVVQALAPRAGGFYVDGTFGGGGYSARILEAAPCRVLGLDRDPAAIARGAALAARADGRLTVRLAKFSEMADVARDLGEAGADGVALDLGLSSDQLDAGARGFSFAFDGPLDMRMSCEGETAADLVNRLDETELAQLLRDYGEERAARRIARAIVKARTEKPITRTRELAQIIEAAAGPQARAERIHPATRSFQALRIAVNDELTELTEGLLAAERLLRPAGRLAVVAFHSLEDRIVKRFLSARAGRGGTPSRHLPPAATIPPSFTLIATHALKPSEAEVARNPRARSARLRAAERTAAAPHPFDPHSLGIFAQVHKGA